MKNNKFELSDIKIGDMVFFSIRGGNNLESYWTVVGMDKDGKIKVKADTKGNNGDQFISVKDIQILHPC